MIDIRRVKMIAFVLFFIFVAGCAKGKMVRLHEGVEKKVVELDAKNLLFVDGKGRVTLTDSQGNIIKPCGRNCKAFNKSGRLQEIGAIGFSKFKTDNPSCVFTYWVGGVRYDHVYECDH